MINLQHLYYALEVERTGSITQAAENLYMGQPNLSRAIRELEASLGMPVFHRSPRGIAPTDKGRQFLRRARSIVEQIRQAEAIFASDGPEQLKLRLAATHTGDFAAAFARFAADAPEDCGMELELRETELRSAIELVSDGTCAAAVVRLGADAERQLHSMRDRGLNAKPLGEQPELVTLSEKHPLAAKAELTPGELEPFTAVRFAVTHGAELHMHGSEPLPARSIVVTDRNTCLSLLGDVDGAYAWLPRLSEREKRRFGLGQRECPESGRVCRDYLITPEDAAPSPALLRFLDFASGCAAPGK